MSRITPINRHIMQVLRFYKVNYIINVFWKCFSNTTADIIKTGSYFILIDQIIAKPRRIKREQEYHYCHHT